MTKNGLTYLAQRSHDQDLLSESILLLAQGRALLKLGLSEQICPVLQPWNQIDTEMAITIRLVTGLMGDARCLHDVLISGHLVAMGRISLNEVTVAIEAATHHTRINLLCHKSHCLFAFTSKATLSNQSLQKPTIQCRALLAMLGRNFDGESFRCSRFRGILAMLSAFFLKAGRMLLRRHVVHSSC